jgi:small-conductance mechanosensitive channel
VCEAFAQEGIEIPFPQQDVHLHSVAREQDAARPA